MNKEKESQKQLLQNQLSKTDFKDILKQFEDFAGDKPPDAILFIAIKDDAILRVINGNSKMLVNVLKSVIDSTSNLFFVMKQALMECQWNVEYQEGKSSSTANKTDKSLVEKAVEKDEETNE